MKGITVNFISSTSPRVTLILRPPSKIFTFFINFLRFLVVVSLNLWFQRTILIYYKLNINLTWFIYFADTVFLNREKAFPCFCFGKRVFPSYFCFENVCFHHVFEEKNLRNAFPCVSVVFPSRFHFQNVSKCEMQDDSRFRATRTRLNIQTVSKLSNSKIWNSI